MCGIFGFVTARGPAAREGGIETWVPRLMRLSSRRGSEACGVAVERGGTLSIYKRALKPARMVKTRGFRAFLASFDSPADPGAVAGSERGALLCVGHTRLVTNGSNAMDENNQPVSTRRLVCVHNGIVTNDGELMGRHPSLEKAEGAGVASDSRVLCALVEHYLDGERSLEDAVAKAYGEIVGSASIALLSSEEPVLVLATNTGALYYGSLEGRGSLVFGSEGAIVYEFLRKEGFPLRAARDAVRRLAPWTGATVDSEARIRAVFSLKGDGMPRGKTEGRPRPPCRIVDAGAPERPLDRCTKCVLPETYPFITFDSAGVCNYCRRYRRQEFLGRAVLDPILEKHRSRNGEPDCLVGFSGGRDSSYALHVLARELGMKPVAYTYDWGLVTDRARRNQARVTGKLGVEQIIRAADIPAKRRYVRKNIHAWLKRPELGMVPLFMAGDKPFYTYGRRLRKETGIDLTVFAAGHQLEQMEFKVGFCGVDKHLENNTRLWEYGVGVKARLAVWYGMQYLKNPGYINEGLLDSIVAFYSSFLNKDDFLYLYRYVPWNEKVIEQTLKEEYGWESDEKYGRNQWRMGDGHTAFINYVYHTVAGFSEFDNFRSNQVREGLLTREEALRLVEEDNRPKIEMLQAFALVIGFNLEEVLLRIKAIPKLYGDHDRIVG